MVVVHAGGEVVISSIVILMGWKGVAGNLKITKKEGGGGTCLQLLQISSIASIAYFQDPGVLIIISFSVLQHDTKVIQVISTSTIPWLAKSLAIL